MLSVLGPNWQSGPTTKDIRKGLMLFNRASPFMPGFLFKFPFEQCSVDCIHVYVADKKTKQMVKTCLEAVCLRRLKIILKIVIPYFLIENILVGKIRQQTLATASQLTGKAGEQEVTTVTTMQQRPQYFCFHPEIQLSLG